MAPWSTVSDFLERIAEGDGRVERLPDEEMRLAAAALLVHAAGIDGTFRDEERQKLKEVLRTHFALSEEDVRRVLREAEAREAEAVDLYRFTSVLCRELDQEGRQRIVAMLWEIAMADGVLHEFESNLVWRAAELLGVSTRDRVKLRKDVATRTGASAEE
jgi:uncharacterized tellurite resistance protein B-like protein